MCLSKCSDSICINISGWCAVRAQDIQSQLKSQTGKPHRLPRLQKDALVYGHLSTFLRSYLRAQQCPLPLSHASHSPGDLK